MILIKWVSRISIYTIEMINIGEIKNKNYEHVFCLLLVCSNIPMLTQLKSVRKNATSQIEYRHKG